MARIPLYNQGRGTTQQLATGSLSPSANVGAFTAPGQATAAFANSAGQIAFNFGQAEQRKQDEDAIQKTNIKFVEDSTQYIRDNPTDNTQTFKTNFNKWKNNWIDKNTNNFSSRRKRLVLNRVNRSVSLKNLEGQQRAYNLGEFNATNLGNQQLEKNLDIMVNFPPDSAEYISADSDKNLIFDNNKKYGRTYKYNQYSFDLAVKKGNFLKQTNNLTSETSLSSYKKNVQNDTTLDFAEKANLINIGEAKYNENVDNQIDGIVSSLIGAKASETTFTTSKNAVVRGLNSFIYSQGGEEKSIDISNLDQNGRNKLISALNIASNRAQGFELKSGRTSLIGFLKTNPSLASMKAKQKAIFEGTGEFSGVSFPVRQSLLQTLNSKVTKKQALANVTYKNNIEQIQNAIKVDAEIKDNTKKLIKETTNLALSIDDSGVMAKDLEMTLTATNQALDLFETSKFDNSNEITATLNELNQAERNEENLDKKMQITKKKELFASLHEARAKEIAKDPYKYFQKELLRDVQPGQEAPTPRDILNAQIEAGVSIKDQRLISTDTETNFINSFKVTTDLKEKTRIYEEFFGNFTLDEQNKIVANMRRRGGIDMVDNIFLAEPDNLVTPDLFVSMTKSVKESVAKLPKTDRDEIFAKVKSELADYSESVIGQISTNYDYAPRTAVTARVDHAKEMENVAYDLAGYYVDNSKLSIDDAVKKAVNNLINNKFEFIRPDNEADGSVRLPKSIVGDSNGYKLVLESVLSEDDNNNAIFNQLNIVLPEGDRGSYVNEIRSKGKFLTKSDNSGVILVDQTGNPVVIRKDTPEGSPEDVVFQLSFAEIAAASEVYKTTPSAFVMDKKNAVQNMLKDKY
tara:strand:+ start:493 stop:3066 length:2574 start_codon:yes stop_codon:yes gene_type:complete